jgi:alkyldihydroxyacetonephosphate synthase
MAEKTTMIPPWFEGETPAGSYRSLFKWGGLREFKHPNRGLYKLIKDTFDLTDADFTQPRNLGLEPFQADAPIRLEACHLERLQRIVGAENLRTDAYTRTRVSYGCGMIDLLRLRNKIVENIPDVVVAPGSTAEVAEIVRYCDEQRIPLYVYGAGSTVTRGTEAVCGGITLDMSKRMNR